ncbi:class I SAM-dependent methyltransferase [Halanaerobium salsuginis]|jgi:predicted methyltransferase|uniref:Putative rRNA methylase n=1 Tax=Halanaerobium salsuginis TaxID=29563 RepID=A0A1I4F6S9_9FIRM|nr:class I SAM-dependent methyltransferase [Halanaerobium salsuginis]SFL13143.1 Putative rRNA methylase [Halanaerobium salsuginis]
MKSKQNNDFASAVAFSHFLLKQHLTSGDAAVDATAGNGHDTKFIAELVGDQGQVYAFDIQQSAIENSKQLLIKNKLNSQVQLIKASHADLDYYIKDNIKAAVFNLGYLPGGDKSIITRADSTIIAVKKLLKLIKQGGIVILVIYSGHPGGSQEKTKVLNYVSQLNCHEYNVLSYKFLNQPGPPPEIAAIKKR